MGEVGFLTAIRLNGLSRYYDLTGDARIPDALHRAVNHMINDLWREEHGAWRYSSCPQSPIRPCAGVILLALANSVRITGDPEHLRLLRKSWEGKFKQLQQVPTAGPGVGKTYSSSMYGCAETVCMMTEVRPGA